MFKIFTNFHVDEDLGSDHNIIVASFSNSGIIHNNFNKTIKLYHKSDWNLINKEINNKMDKLIINHKSTRKEIDNYVIQLANNINKSIDNNVKTKVIKEKQIGLPEYIRNMIKDKKTLT